MRDYLHDLSRPSSPGHASFPRTRLRRNRRWPWIREMVQETRFVAANLIWPIFVIEGTNRREPIHSMPGVE
ncbi:MAG: porphobilinogen synthase, partial [bacterium]